MRLRRYVVIELKAVDDLLRHEDGEPAIGPLLCRSRKRIVVEYALRGGAQPIGVAGSEARLVATLPQEFRGSLPAVEEIEAELSEVSGEVRDSIPIEPYGRFRAAGVRC